MNNENVLVSQMLIGVETLTTESLLLGIYSSSVELPSAGEAKQTCVALSTAEAEYMALASAAQEAMWLQQITTDLRMRPTGVTVIYEDNRSAISMAKNPQFHGRSKHIAISTILYKSKSATALSS